MAISAALERLEINCNYLSYYVALYAALKRLEINSGLSAGNAAL
jgi:hypothetical protein